MLKRKAFPKILIFGLSLLWGLVSYGFVDSVQTTVNDLTIMQEHLASLQKSQGEWAGINEGDPRWDVMFMVYTNELYKSGFAFVPKTTADRVINETIDRLKAWRGFQKNGWALHGGHQISVELTGSVLLGLNHVDPNIVKTHFQSQQDYWNKNKWTVSNLSVLDRTIFRMMGAPGYIPIPLFIDPATFMISKDAGSLNMASLGYYRWGFIAVSVWTYYDHLWDIRHPIAPMTDAFIARKGYYVSHPEESSAVLPNFWAREGLMWLLQRQHGDGNPSPTLIIQQAFFAAHRAGVMDLSKELESGWKYLESIRYPMRNNIKVFQPSISPIWDTGRVLRALESLPESTRIKSFAYSEDNINKAIQFLLKQQDVEGGDYLMANPNFKPGGWGFAYGSNKYPDSDDTAVVVDALLPHTKRSPVVAEAVKKGISWLLQMQNETGGWPAWDYHATGAIEFLIQNTDVLPNTSLEPQSDVSARVMRALYKIKQSGFVQIPDEVFTRGCSFLKKKVVQTASGLKAWRGTWAVNYLYGTSEALTTITMLECQGDISLSNYLTWIETIQNADGGWGESDASYTANQYVPGPSTITQTLGALQFLLAYEDLRLKKHPEWPSAAKAIEKGIQYYLSNVNANGDITDESDPTVTACYACPHLLVRYDLIPMYMGTEILGKYLAVVKGVKK